MKYVNGTSNWITCFNFCTIFCCYIQYEGPTLELTTAGVSHFEADCEKVKLI
jgi:hypothetical protein